jgi:hypothetical protein
VSAIEKLLEQQARVPEYSAPWMVAEQLMDICRREPHSAQLIDQDLDNPEMGIVQAEAKIRAYSDANRKGAKCFCVTPIQAEKILREFYGLPENGGQGSRAGGENVLNLADFFG